MLAGLQKYSHRQIQQRASSPKFQVLNNALMSAVDGRALSEIRRDSDYWGRLTESCIGAHLLNSCMGTNFKVYYWRERNHEVDFVLQHGRDIVAIEVKSGKRREVLPGMELFSKRFMPKRKLMVGGQGISVEEFLLKPISHWFD